MKKVAFYTLGCKLNYSETSTIARQFTEKGFQKVDFYDNPDIFIINTCSVTENADKKCKKLVKEAQKISPNAYIAIMGCYAQLKPQEIANIEGVDAVLGAAEKFRLFDLIPTFEKNINTKIDNKDTNTIKNNQETSCTDIAQAKIFVGDVNEAKIFHSSYSYGDRTRTFLKVQDGCDYSCTFCTIPQARGESRSDSIANVIEKAKEIAQSEVKEIVLTGVNTGDFGLQNGKRVEKFFDLVKALDSLEGIERIRISSIEPNLLTDEIIEFTLKNARLFVPHFHIPLQSGSNKILKLMKRRYLRELYADRVAKIKAIRPDCCIGVDVIVGFPGETQEDFLETYQFLNDLDISYLHVFTYSERANTEALHIKPVVPAHIRNERSKMLHILSDKKRRYFYEQNIGSVRNVLFENDVENGQMEGFTENYIRVVAKYDAVLVNEIKTLQLSKINENMLMEVEECEEILTH
ncbi:MAG: tRNA (N(6)-L-threonylcarbamoyladenosine(37)-C(2))-methylthiotransferase MtaB [Bacteroidetes bacterium]|nr:MAG: tRNA (N(6)-L-threonylcarbamoyladenosine(37)-C(2))-methylthiotransferase MtaB [Bacteroidota bacterium]TAG90649.1 MAG: tRNA (N(6)-L-threonylcarbamoyladenosine(37)-C(2))-methylthiotransferase MtaB [Bacteroidota bacterium]